MTSLQKLSTLLLAACAALAFAAPASAQTNVRIRGAITSLDGQVLTVKTREGPEVKIKLADNYSVAAVVPIAMDQIKAGSYVGSAAMKQADGSLKAVEVLVFPAAMKGANEGHYPWDLMPESTMTNATVEAVVDGTAGREMSLSYKGGTQKITVPAGVPIVTFEPGDKSMLTPGALVFVGSQQAADGSFSAGRVNVGKNGFKPPM
jgi:hypothetical protein